MGEVRDLDVGNREVRHFHDVEDETSMVGIFELITPSLSIEARLLNQKLCYIPEETYLQEKIPDMGRDISSTDCFHNDDYPRIDGRDITGDRCEDYEIQLEI